jgi:homocysteine S-methyltransferase
MERFHLSRLQLLTKANWSMIEGILFETISLISEITAIRKSVSLSRVKQNLEDKDLFISMVFPSGRLPGWDIEPCISDERNHITEISTETGMQAIVDATFTPFMGQAMVRGIGINCTKPQCLKELVNSLTQAISKIPRGEPPTLLLYPDGGVEWENNGFKGGISIEEWCRDVWDSVQLALKAGPGVWGRLIVGGCCNTGPAHIQRLHEIVSQSDA